MSDNNIIKKISIIDSITSTRNTKDIGSEGQNVTVSYDNSGHVIEDITDPEVTVASTKSASKAVKDINTALGGKASIAALNNKADLVDGKVPSAQLPSYVDDVIEGYYNIVDHKFYTDSSFTIEITGEHGKIYIDLNTNSMYRWSGSEYVIIFNLSEIDLEDLTNVEIGTIQSVVDGESLVYDSTLGKWVNKMATAHFITPPTVTIGTYTYNGQPQGPTIVKSADFDNYVITTGATGTDAGTYELRFSLKNTNSDIWSDLTTEDKVYNYSIGKAAGSITLSENSITLDSDHLSATVSVTATGNISVSSSDTGIATASVSNGVITINNVNEETGEATITVNSAATNNYTAASQTISVSAEFTIYALVFSSDNNFTLSVGTPEWDGILEYSLDERKTYYTWNGSELSGTANQPIYVRGSGNTVITDFNNPWTFTGKYCTGNIENLLDYQTVRNGEHPTMASSCYICMFQNCTSLITAPELPANTLSYECYSSMFQNCTSLTTAPALPATTLKISCYSRMFKNCTSLITIPTLPATTLTDNCYTRMFENCISLKLSATKIGEYQYEYRIPVTGTGTTANWSLDDMFTSTGGTFTGTPTINTTYYTSNQII